MLADAGFDVICAKDVTDHVRENWALGYAKATTVLQAFGMRELWRRLSLEDLLLRGGRQAMILKDQYYANVFPKLAADAGVLRYGYILAERRVE